MTAEEIRDLGYLKWRDPWAWMETMKGKRWENHIKREKEHFNELANQPSVQREARQMEKEVKYAQQYTKLPSFKIGAGTIDIIPNGSKFSWKWSWSKKSKLAHDIDVQGNIVWYVTSDDDQDQYYKNELICESADGKVLWKKKAVSSQIAVVGDLCYFIKVIDYFTTVELCVCNAHTGNEENVLYRERDKKRDLVLIKGANRTLYLSSSSPLYDILYKVKDTKIIQLAKSSMLQMPLGESVYGDDCILVKKTKKDTKWIQLGKPINKWKLPDEEIQWVNLQSGMILTIHEGAQTIWYCSENNPKLLFKIKVGTVDPNIWTSWENALVQTFTVKTPSEVPFMINIINNKVYRDERKIPIEHPITFPQLEIHKFHATSKDGTKVPYISLFEKGIKPKAQFVYVYGAYGSTTPVGWPFTNWYPLIKRKWAIVFAFVRGGGDIDSAWAEVARRENRHVVVDDFEAVIKDSQRKLKLGPKETVIFGRSAGGLPVGAIVSRFPDGELVGAAFTEVPYVDVLRTSSNPDLPLTIGEFDEFGNPLERMINFKELLTVSPVNTLPPDGAPGVFVMSRVGLVDKQVFAYESFKWIQKLRGFANPDNSNMSDAKGKYVTFERDEAHHYRSSKFSRFRAIDLAILDTWVEGKLKL
jgi:hypothetical protein